MPDYIGTVHVFVNAEAGRGAALSRWTGLEKDLRAQLPDLKVWMPKSYRELVEQVRTAAREQGSNFLAAGGDGTVQAVLDGLFDEQGKPITRQTPFVGGFGLGLENRLYKPLGSQSAVGGIAARWKPEDAMEWDVIQLELVMNDGTRQIRHALQSVHLGIVAAAHREVRLPSGIWKYLLNWMGFRAQALLSVWQAFRDQGFNAEIRSGDESWKGLWSGLHLVKYPWVAGNFVMKTPRLPGDGKLDLAFYQKPAQPIESMTLIGTFEQQGLNQPKVTYRESLSGEARLESAGTVCFDGELATIRELRWQVLPKAIRLGN
ncbi:MAG TPA: diacylglycerol kinase family protein [Candidatus Ozemobacteraceae bacterium]|nr:diacylglycerol kinase family protein [Candidatus Ozemobacteraceae bacterium]